MDDRSHGGFPMDLAKARELFAAWRRRKLPRDRIPAGLWDLAVKLAGAHGVHRTSSSLRLDYYSLKKRVEQASGVKPSAAFIEVTPAPIATGGECVIELENGAGASMRVTLRGCTSPNLAALIDGFWNAD